MSLINRIKNIIKSNINYQKDVDIDLNLYNETYFDDAKEEIKSNDIEKQYYKILEIEYGSEFKEIKRAYKKLLKKYHPDFFADDAKKMEAAQKLTKKINEAYTYFERKYL